MANVVKANGSLDGHVNEIGQEQISPFVEDRTGQTEVEVVIEDVELDKLPKRRKKQRCKGK